MLVIDRECLELEDKSQNYICKKADKYQQLHKLHCGLTCVPDKSLKQFPAPAPLCLWLIKKGM